MSSLGSLNLKRCFQLISGVAGIYFTYILSGVFHQWMIKIKYANRFAPTEQNFIWPLGFLVFPTLITWVVGAVVNRFTIQRGTETQVPAIRSIICAVTVGISTITYTYAIYWTNYPVVMMVKSCNILSVILVGVLCSGVSDRTLKLGGKKIIVGIFVTAGIIVFKFYDPKEEKQGKETQFLGILLLFISLLADGFLPDFQAVIKSNFKPRPMEMMTDINKWVCLLSLGASVISFQLLPMLVFIWEHSLFAIHMFLMSALSTLGQMFVYRMIKQFKQHFVPFVITTRKIFTVGVSIVYYQHPTNAGQITGILLVLGIVVYEFVSELMDEKKDHQQVQAVASNETSLASDQLDVETKEGLSVKTEEGIKK